MQIVVRQTSGLGNQLFQYAAGRYLAKKYAGSLRIAHELPKNLTIHGASRPVLLRKFAISAPIGQANAFDRFVLSTRPLLATPARIARAACKIQVIREDPSPLLLHPDLEVDVGSRAVYLLGYWQVYSMVRDVEGELRVELSPVEPLGRRSMQVAEQIRAARNPVSIHLRRGDYLTVFGAKAILPMAYYERAMQYLLDTVGACTFFVFSDDASYAEQWAQTKRQLIVVDHNDAATAHEDLQLMALCRHHIIANSTFSWWGAWLNPRTDKQVIAPSNWLGFDTSKTTLAVPEWKLIEA
jgi:hypothetical protein